MELHSDLIPLQFLIGIWRGSGRGEYPTIEPFTYTEEVSFQAGPGKPFLLYVQRTRGADGLPLHSESGFVRATAEGPELVVAQPTGLTEVHSGTLNGTGLQFESVAMGATATAKAVAEVSRHLAVDGDVLSYTLDMAYADVPLSLHLEAKLERVVED
ncbi:MAG: FABP family protein [Acidimicrobiia bacterium]